MRFFLYKLKERVNKLKAPMLTISTWAAFFLSLVTILLIVYSVGYEQKEGNRELFYLVYKAILITFASIYSIRIIIDILYENRRSGKDWFSLFLIFNLLYIVYDIKIFGEAFNIPFIYNYRLLILVLSYISIVELSSAVIDIISRSLHPHLIFVTSFTIIIIVGTSLLLLPNSTYYGISFTDALFISTSATCVTGLSSIPFTETFTTTGQIVVLALIQIGGLGVITITSFFALFFMGGITVQGEYVLKDIISGNRSSKLLSLLLKIVLVTFTIEAIGALFIYLSTHNHLDMSQGEKLFFAVFHSISAFCNAGFSTLPQNLSDPQITHIAPLYLIVSFLIVSGGIGFPIFFNIIKIAGHRVYNLIKIISKKKRFRYVREWDMNSIVVIRTTAILILTGLVAFLAFEWNGALKDFSSTEKIVQALFNSVTTRTAGFNSVDTASLNKLTIYLFLILMWIGGAPQSTAGGIKVTTFALMVRNAVQMIKGEERIEFHGREISSASVTRAFATVFFSIAFIFTAFVLLSIWEPTIDAQDLLFEIVSAIGTVGLSAGITTSLSDPGKFTIIVLMFIGRVGVITFISAFVKSRMAKRHRYPGADILIN